MKARSGCSWVRAILLLDIFFEYIKRNPSARIHEVRTRPENRLAIELVDMFSKFLPD
jgi:hypothetical protein